MLTDVLHIGEAAEHTRVVADDTADTVGTVLDVLAHVGSSIVQLDVLGDTEGTAQVEVVLVVVRVVLSSLYVIVGVRETNIVLLGGVGDGHVVSLVETGAEHLVPLITTDGLVGTLGTVEVGHLTAVVAGTIAVVGLTVGSPDLVAIAVEAGLTETGQSVGVVVAQYPVVITRTELALDVGHIGHLVPAQVNTELDIGASAGSTLLGGDHDNAVGSL